MSRRKPPVITVAHRDNLFAIAATLRAEVEKNVLAAVKLQTDAISGLLKLEALFGQPPQPPTQTVPPPASGWRSMASAPRDGKWISAKCECDAFVAIRWEERRLLWVSRMGTVFFDFELAAWAPIPEWTGEVFE